MGLLPDKGLLAVQQLLIKGLYRPETEVITIEVWLGTHLADGHALFDIQGLTSCLMLNLSQAGGCKAVGCQLISSHMMLSIVVNAGSAVDM